MSPVRRPALWVFAVDDQSVQILWRDLVPGTLRLRVETECGATPIAPERSVAVDERPGSLLVDGLPAGQELRAVADVPGVGGAGRGALPFRTLDALPGAELLRIATVSDLHLGTTVFGHQGTIREVPEPEVAHPERCARAAIGEATEWGAQHLVVKGDITNHGQVPEWRTYRRLLDQAPMPVDALPGNHDRAQGGLGQGLTPEEASAAFGVSIATPVRVRDRDGLRIVLVDSTSGGKHLGRVKTFASDIVDAVAEVEADRAVLVVMHHHLQPHLVSEGWPIGVPHEESVRFLEQLARTDRRVMVTSGHTHRHRRWDHAGITTTQVGSTKDYPGVWAGYVIQEGGLRQVVRRVSRPDCLRWTDQTRRAGLGLWRWAGPGRLPSRCFNLVWA